MNKLSKAIIFGYLLRSTSRNLLSFTLISRCWRVCRS